MNAKQDRPAADNEAKSHSTLKQYVDESPHGTEFRRLAKRVLDYLQPTGPLVLMVTSSMRGEGKTTVASNLAISLARRKEKKILLVDADLRRPQVHSLFGLNRRNGLAEVLENQLNARATYKSTKVDNLAVITGGRFQKSPAKLFEDDKIEEVIATLKLDFDIVICDFPPTIPVSEPEMVAKFMDGVLFVFLAGKTPREVGQRGVSILQKAEAKIIGVVVNDLSEVLPYHYRYRYYKYYTSKSELSAVKSKQP